MKTMAKAENAVVKPAHEDHHGPAIQDHHASREPAQLERGLLPSGPELRLIWLLLTAGQNLSHPIEGQQHDANTCPTRHRELPEPETTWHLFREHIDSQHEDEHGRHHEQYLHAPLNAESEMPGHVHTGRGN